MVFGASLSVTAVAIATVKFSSTPAPALRRHFNPMTAVQTRLALKHSQSELGELYPQPVPLRSQSFVQS